MNFGLNNGVAAASIVTGAPLPRQSKNKKAVPWQGGPRDAAVNFDTYQILQRYRAISLPHARLSCLSLSADNAGLLCKVFEEVAPK